MKRRKKIMIILGIVLVFIGFTAWYIYKEYNRVHEDMTELKPDFSVSAIQLIRDFETDEQSSNKKYWNKVIQLDGIVKEVKTDDHGFYSVVLGDTSSTSSVRCSMDSLHNKEASSVQKGKPTIIKGLCTGFNADELLGSDVILVRSVVCAKK